MSVINKMLVVSALILLLCCTFADGIVPYRSWEWFQAGGICQVIPLLLPGFIALSVLRNYLKDRDALINFEALAIILISMFEAWLILHCKFFDHHLSKLFTLDPGDMYVFYEGLLIFEIAYNLPIQQFLKTFGQIMIIGLLSSSACILVTGYGIGQVWDYPGFTMHDALFFGVLSYPIYPVELVRKLKRLGQSTKTITILLEGETLVGLFSAFLWSTIVHEAFTMNNEGGKSWYYYVAIIGIKFIDLGISYSMGIMAAFLMRNVCISKIDMAMVTFSVAFLAQAFHLFMSFFSKGVSCVGVITVGITLNIRRASQTKEVQFFLETIWEFLALIMNYGFVVGYGVIILFRIYPTATMKDYAMTLVTYTIATAARFVSYLIFMPILQRLGYGYTWQQMFICCWGSMKNPIVLVLVYRMNPVNDHAFHTILLHGVFLYVWNMLINGMSIYFIMKQCGYYIVSEKTIMNMKRSLRTVNNYRQKTIDVLKMDKFLSDANWDVIQKGTILPGIYYSKRVSEEEEFDFLENRVTRCPDCKKDVVYKPTPKEFHEMTHEAKMRILKAKKMAYLKRFEKGLLPLKCYLILLQTVEIAMDSKDATIKLDLIVKLFKQDNWFYTLLMKKLYKLFVPPKEHIKKPRKMWRRCCYHIVMNVWFEVFIYFITIFQVNTVVYRLIMRSTFDEEEYLLFAGFSLTYFLIYLTEFFLKLFAYSWIYVYKHGIKRYFKSKWNILEFILLLLNLVDLNLYLVDLIRASRNIGSSVPALIFESFRMLRLIRLFKLLGPAYARLAVFMERKNNAKKLMAYDTACGHLFVEREILENIDLMFDNKEIKGIILEQMEMDRIVFVELLGEMCVLRPWIQVTSKTIQASLVVRNHMHEALLQLKKNGWVDILEFRKLLVSIDFIDKQIRKLRNVSPCSPLTYFSEITWMAGDKKMTHYLYDNSVVKKFKEGGIIFDVGDIAQGIYFVVSGIVQITYEPNSSILQHLYQDGSVPIVDYKRYASYEDMSSDQIIPGNVIGEHGFLAQRSYSAKVFARCASTTYYIKEEFLRQAMVINSDPVNGLKCRMWKTVAVRVAPFVLADQPGYQTMSRDDLLFQLERSFVPDLSNYKVFILNDQIKDIVLIEGLVVDFNTRDIYTGPCYIPRTVQRLFLTKRTLNDLDIASRLLIIPIEGVDEYDIMLTAEETCELISNSSSKCLRHLETARKQKLKKELRFRSEGTPATRGGTMAFSKSSTIGGAKASSYLMPKNKSSASRSLRTIKEAKSEAEAGHSYHSVIALNMDVFNAPGEDKK